MDQRGRAVVEVSLLGVRREDADVQVGRRRPVELAVRTVDLRRAVLHRVPGEPEASSSLLGRVEVDVPVPREDLLVVIADARIDREVRENLEGVLDEEREELAGDVERRRRKKVPARAGAARRVEIMLVEDRRRRAGPAGDSDDRSLRQVAKARAALRARADREQAGAGVEGRSGGDVFLVVTAELDLVGSEEQRHGAAGGIPSGFVVDGGPEDLSEPSRSGPGKSQSCLLYTSPSPRD